MNHTDSRTSGDAPRVFRPLSMGAALWKLLRLRLVIFFNGFRRAKLRNKIAYGFAVLGLLMLLGFILFLSVVLLNFLRSPELIQIMGDPAPILRAFPTMLISAGAIGILLTGFGVLLQALYLSGDMDFLMSAPIPIRAVFMAKLIQAVLPNFLIMAAFTLPILFGLGVSGRYNVLYYPMVVIVLALISLAAAALASLLVMAAARFFPAKRMAEVLGFVVGTSMFILSQSSRFARWDVTDRQMASVLQATGRFNQPWSPLAWAGNGLVALGEGRWLAGIGLLALALAFTAAVFGVALVTAERLYYTGWSSLQTVATGKKKAPKLGAPKLGAPISDTTLPPAAQPRTAAPLSRLAALLPAPVRAILVKDMLMYRRDLRSMSNLITPLILGIVYAISMLRTGQESFAGRGEAPGWFMSVVSTVLLYGDVALALFFGWMLVMNLAGGGFSQEGKHYWLLKAAPLPARTLLGAKFLVSYLPTLLLCSVYVVVLQILKGGGVVAILNSLAAVALSLAGLTGIYLALGTAGARFDWENPAQKNRAVGCLGMLGGMLYLGVVFVLFVVPPVGAGLLKLPIWTGQVLGLALGGALSLAAGWLPLKAVEARVATLAE